MCSRKLKKHLGSSTTKINTINTFCVDQEGRGAPLKETQSKNLSRPSIAPSRVKPQKESGNLKPPSHYLMGAQTKNNEY